MSDRVDEVLYPASLVDQCRAAMTAHAQRTGRTVVFAALTPERYRSLPPRLVVVTSGPTDVRHPHVSFLVAPEMALRAHDGSLGPGVTDVNAAALGSEFARGAPLPLLSQMWCAHAGKVLVASADLRGALLDVVGALEDRHRAHLAAIYHNLAAAYVGAIALPRGHKDLGTYLSETAPWKTAQLRGVLTGIVTLLELRQGLLSPGPWTPDAVPSSAHLRDVYEGRWGLVVDTLRVRLGDLDPRLGYCGSDLAEVRADVGPLSKGWPAERFARVGAIAPSHGEPCAQFPSM